VRHQCPVPTALICAYHATLRRATVPCHAVKYLYPHPMMQQMKQSAAPVGEAVVSPSVRAGAAREARTGPIPRLARGRCEGHRLPRRGSSVAHARMRTRRGLPAGLAANLFTGDGQRGVSSALASADWSSAARQARGGPSAEMMVSPALHWSAEPASARADH
jgi:hypothetical protein